MLAAVAEARDSCHVTVTCKEQGWLAAAPAASEKLQLAAVMPLATAPLRNKFSAHVPCGSVLEALLIHWDIEATSAFTMAVWLVFVTLLHSVARSVSAVFDAACR